MIIKNVKIFTADHTFESGVIEIKDGHFSSVKFEKEKNLNLETEADAVILDGQGCYAIPGLIDLHFHGCMGYDFCNGTKEAIEQIAAYEASAGVTAIAPATMTLPVKELEAVLTTAAEYKKEELACQDYQSKGRQRADLVGINMEGPFISPVKKGAQDPANMIPCDADLAERFLEASDGLVKFMGLAPEEADSETVTAYIERMRERVNLSLAHTNADYDSARAAIEAGVHHVVHLYNAMPAFTHRAPGVIGAAAENQDVTVELICDGIHIHPAVVRSTFQMFGKERIILISDSMEATGMSDGRYSIGGMEVAVQGKRAALVSDGTLAGSVTNLMDCMRNAVKEMGIPLETAVGCAAVNPAKKLGIYDQYGSIETGKKANVVLLDADLNVQKVVKDGRLIME